jgi:ferrous iron transport protein A
MKSISDLETGEGGLVYHLRGGKDFANRMAALGFTVGAEVRVVQNYCRGPVIVSVRHVRVALGRGEAHKVLVEVMDRA